MVRKETEVLKIFRPTAWVIDHKVSVYVVTLLISLLGLYTYLTLPKEQFPEVVIPTILVNTIYPGTSPEDVETLITRPIEKQLKSVTGVKTIRSRSVQDFSSITVEFELDVDPAVAKRRVQDAVDKAKSDLPDDLKNDPEVREIDFSEIPIMAVNVSGDFALNRLKKYAEALQDRIEALPEITRVDLIGAPEREIQVNLDPFLMQAAGVSFRDVINAIRNNNLNISAGNVKVDGTRRTLRIVGEFETVEDIQSLVVRGSMGSRVFLKDIAEVRDGFKERESYARLNGKPVITLSVIKKSGENLIDAADKIKHIIEEMRQNVFPKALEVVITNDQSQFTRTSLKDLNNSVIIGFILVTIVLMFFMGVQNALFVGLAVPLSVAMAVLVLPPLDYTFNMVVTFSFLLALGIIVDDAIVVIENTYRLYTREKLPIKDAARLAAGEVFAPVLAGTLTTLAPFFPLLFWPGVPGKFMRYLPVVLILTLTASLIVAFLMNPVFAVDFMPRGRRRDPRRLKITIGVLAIVSGLLYAVGFHQGGNLGLILIGLIALNHWFVSPVLIHRFQTRWLPRFMGLYRRTLDRAIRGKVPYMIVGGTVALLIATFVLLGIVKPKVEFFASPEPNFVYIYIKTPVGTDAAVTDSLTRMIEQRVYEVLGKDNPAVQTVLANVGIGAGDPMRPDRSVTPHKGKITIAFKEYHERQGISTFALWKQLQEAMPQIPGVEISVEKQRFGPPVGKPITIEIRGEDFQTLLALERRLIDTLENVLQIPGIEGLRSDLEKYKPELYVQISREKALREGLSIGQIGSTLRTALFGTEAAKFRDGEDEYPIQVRIKEQYRYDIGTLLNLPITFREMSTGRFRSIPIAAVATVSYGNSYGGINRKDLKRVITLSSEVTAGYNANVVRAQIQQVLDHMVLPQGYEIVLTGEQEEQQKSQRFLSLAFVVSIFLIFLVMVTEFNSVFKPLIIMSTVVFSTIGVFLGYMLFGLTISIALTGVGIVSLGGVVVKNGIVLLDFVEILRQRGYRTRQAIKEGAAIRFTPVLLTAASTILGLIPLALGMNIDFGSFLDHFDPKISFGGVAVAFWRPLASAVIFGLGFAFFLTLVVVPSMYYVYHVAKLRYERRRWHRQLRLQNRQGV